MPTTVHLPVELLDNVDRRAGELGVSRNRFIIRALEKAIDEQTAWSPGFLQVLDAAAEDTDSHDTIDEIIEAIAAKRTRKRHPRL